MRTWSLLVALVLASPGCSDDTKATPNYDSAVTRDQSAADHSAAGSEAKAADQKAAVEASTTADAKTGDKGSTGAWPPPTPYHNGKACALPACDPKGAVTVDLSGKWTQKITTVSSDCNALAVAARDELKPGHVQTLTGQEMVRSGECIYKGSVGGTVFGVIKGNVMISCEVLPGEPTGLGGVVTPVVEGQVTFTSNKGTGSAWTYLFDLPAITPPTNCKANFTAEFIHE